MKLKIYQMVPDVNTIHLLYRELLLVLSKCAGRVPAECYECVYTGEVLAGTMEDVFTIFNIRHPEGYRGRSLSMSDVVEVISEEVEPGFYYCDTYAFKKIAFEKERCIGGDEDE